MDKSRKRLILAALLGGVIVALAGFELNLALNERIRILADPAANETVTCGPAGNIVQWVCFTEFAPRAVWSWQVWRWAFIKLDSSTLAAAIFFTAGLAGGIIALLLHLTGAAGSEIEWGAGGLLRILLGGAAGLLAYFLLLLVPDALHGARLTNYATREDLARAEFFKSWILLPTAAGVFTTVFFEKLKKIFEGMMDRIGDTLNKQKKGGSE